MYKLYFDSLSFINIIGFRRSRIRRATENEFPGNSIPTFRSNPEAKKRLDVLVKQLAKSCSIQELNFGEGKLFSLLKVIYH